MNRFEFTLNYGEGYILSQNFSRNKMTDIINNDEKFYCEYILCEYIPAKKVNKIWLERDPRPIIYSNVLLFL